MTYKNISKKRRRYFSDLYTTLLDSSWNYCVLMFTTSFYGSWLIFGSLYFMICYTHGDLLEENLAKGSGWVPCIKEIDGFASCFLFSLETQQTIGYGSRQTTTNCPDAMLVMSVQVPSQYLSIVKLSPPLAQGCSGLHHTGFHGGAGLLKTVPAKKQKQDNHLQQPSSSQSEEWEAVPDHQDWRSEG